MFFLEHQFNYSDCSIDSPQEVWNINSISQMHQHRYLGAIVCLEVYFRDLSFHLMTEANSNFKALFICNHNKMLKTSTSIINLI